MNKEIQQTTIKMLYAICEGQNKINQMVKLEMKKIDIIIEEIQGETPISYNNLKALKELNKLQKSLTMHDWIMLEKIEAVEEIIEKIL